MIAVTGVLSISVAAPLFKLASPTHPLVASAWRLSVAGLVWLPFALHAIRRAPLNAQERAVGSWAALCYALHFGAWVWSLELTSVAASTTLVTTTPLMLAIVGGVTGQDAPSKRAWVGICVALTGAVMLAFMGPRPMNPTGHAWTGDLLALLGAGAMAIYLLKVRALGEVVRLAPLSAMATLGGASLLWLTCVLTLPNEALRPQGDQALWALLGAALIPQLIGHATLTESLKTLTPTEVGALTLFEPIGASLLAWLWLGEPITLSLALLCLVILLGVRLAL